MAFLKPHWFDDTLSSVGGSAQATLDGLDAVLAILTTEVENVSATARRIEAANAALAAHRQSTERAAAALALVLDDVLHGLTVDLDAPASSGGRSPRRQANRKQAAGSGVRRNGGSGSGFAGILGLCGDLADLLKAHRGAVGSRLRSLEIAASGIAHHHRDHLARLVVLRERLGELAARMAARDTGRESDWGDGASELARERESVLKDERETTALCAGCETVGLVLDLTLDLVKDHGAALRAVACKLETDIEQGVVFHAAMDDSPQPACPERWNDRLAALWRLQRDGILSARDIKRRKGAADTAFEGRLAMWPGGRRSAAAS